MSSATVEPEEPSKSFSFSRLVRAGGYVAIVLAMSAFAVTFLILIGQTPIEVTLDVVTIAMIVNGSLVAFLVLVVGWELGSLLLARRRGRTAARLHIRIIGLFAIVAAVPVILVAIVAFTLDRGLDSLFSTRMRSIIETSLLTSKAYVTNVMQSDLIGLKIDFERARQLLVENPSRFQTFIESASAARRIPAIFLVDGRGDVITQTRAAAVGDFPPIPKDILEDAKDDGGQALVILPGGTPETANVMGGVVKLAGYNDVFLYVTRKVPNDIVEYIGLTEATANEYERLERSRFDFQIVFSILYLGVSLVVVLAAIWLGIAFANWLVSPIRRLIDAAKEVSRGNLGVAVAVKSSEGDVGALSDTFNTMTSQLRNQRTELLTASEQMDSRRRFTEAVLSGVPAGVIGLDRDGGITIANRTALSLLGIAEGEAIGQPVSEALPQLEPIVSAVLRENRVESRGQIVITRAGRERTINVRLTTEREGTHGHGYVVTLDDITDLVNAQRSSAWADVARRIAHEIKNPLTPIQLSAERLRRKFGRAITEDRAIFDQCTDTIIRQVGDIGRMVDEFSGFARMPKPAIEVRDLAESVREAVFLLEVGHPDITFSIDLPGEPLIGRFDARLMAQALTNIVKNAAESVSAVTEREEPGTVRIAARIVDDSIVIDVVDNGVGLPQEGRRRLLEPYMTTREKGTGLGLAIVTKIIEDHGGKIDLLDAPEVQAGGRGALVRVTLPRAQLQENDGAPADNAAPDTSPAKDDDSNRS